MNPNPLARIQRTANPRPVAARALAGREILASSRRAEIPIVERGKICQPLARLSSSPRRNPERWKLVGRTTIRKRVRKIRGGTLR
jgi:hypothetical protein